MASPIAGFAGTRASVIISTLEFQSQTNGIGPSSDSIVRRLVESIPTQETLMGKSPEWQPHLGTLANANWRT